MSTAAESLVLTDAQALAAARLRLLGAARRRLAVRMPALPPTVLAADAELAELRRIATAGRGAHIRLLVHDAEAMLREGHRLLTLVQRLPSLIEVRVPVDETELACPSAYLLADTGGYLFQPLAERPQGRAVSGDPAAQAPYLRRFDAVWQRARPAGVLRVLDL